MWFSFNSQQLSRRTMTAKKVEAVTDARSVVFEKMLKAQQKQFGSDTCYIAPEHEKAHYGILLPSFALQYLLTSNALLFEKIVGLSGEKGSGKSALGYEFARMMAMAGGMAADVETENKSNPILIRSFMREFSHFFKFHRAKTMEQAQERLTSLLTEYKKLCPNKDVPLYILLDSLTGNKAEETIEKFTEDGHGDRSFSKEALIIAQFFGVVGDFISGFPISLVYTVHQKVKVETGGFKGHGDQTRTPGGSAPDFMATWHIKVQRIASMKSKSESGNTLKLTTQKNSMGEDRRSIEVDYRWETFADENGNPDQKSWFDWAKADCDLLAGDKIPRSRVGEFLNVTAGSEKRTYTCPELNIKSQAPEELMAALHNQPDLLKKLNVVLGIYQWRIYGAS